MISEVKYDGLKIYVNVQSHSDRSQGPLVRSVHECFVFSLHIQFCALKSQPGCDLLHSFQMLALIFLTVLSGLWLFFAYLYLGTYTIHINCLKNVLPCFLLLLFSWNLIFTMDVLLFKIKISVKTYQQIKWWECVPDRVLRRSHST